MISAKNRFHRRNHVNRVYKEGKSVRGPSLSVKYRFNPGGGDYKLAVSVSKKVAKSAVVRNRIRRRIFEIVRLDAANIPDGFEGVVGVFDKSAAEKPHEELQKQLTSLLAKAR